MGAMSDAPRTSEVAGVPIHRAEHLLLGRGEARIVLGEQVYTLRLTRAGKLILTK
ncbi:hemin uptake protein HemP [Hasllibacter halocynthiae]|uniref:Hemin uptake protein HemP n=1 Tax=Hasllibacter halocynthiae TaxID=595589 RepID=A0A2T0X4D8_9RHOB|nr:hemin uptake protein HemP [Hasllibacter halocynthiae]PRY93810.1 hemin uptake protein HemP [Hasllibacter halocynthiae]